MILLMLKPMLKPIEAGRDANDPDHAADTSCSYCHGFAPTATDLKNAACYNCHLGAHQPLDRALVHDPN